ncbi:MAG TPA: hypothetical protein VHZ51_21080 [Ktedonobacteraceae bacterium]|jgi:hypothetical protein|nr:hypothetical protein [Ktedonobacteraceae bacterium]
MAQAVGLAARVQGLRRYYALLLTQEGSACLLKVLDGEQVLGTSGLRWELDRTYAVQIQVNGSRIQAWIDGQRVFDVQDRDRPLLGGSIALICQEGRMASDAIHIRPARAE